MIFDTGKSIHLTSLIHIQYDKKTMEQSIFN